jgi:hypothetical protein
MKHDALRPLLGATTSRPVTGAPPADQESVALCISIFLIGVDFGSLVAAEKLLPKGENILPTRRADLPKPAVKSQD